MSAHNQRGVTVERLVPPVTPDQGWAEMSPERQRRVRADVDRRVRFADGERKLLIRHAVGHALRGGR